LHMNESDYTTNSKGKLFAGMLWLVVLVGAMAFVLRWMRKG